MPSHIPAEIADFDSVVGFANEATIDDQGWTVIPYGMHPHAMGMQRFGREEATKMVGYFRSTWNRIKRAITGLPVFNGHPDLPAMANEYPDKAEYGQIADMDVRANGLGIKMVLSSSGAKLIEQGKKFISPHWLANQVGKTQDGRPIFAPVFMKSIGLTDTPNIPNPTSLLNTATPKIMNKEKLIKLLGLANEADETTIETAIAGLLKRPESSALANEQTARTVAEGTVTTLANENKTLKTELEGTKVAFANERKARIDEVIAGAIRLGKITESEKPVWEKRLTRDFDEESKSLANSAAKVKTDAITAGKGFDEAAAKLKEANANLGNETDDDGDSMANSKAKMAACVNEHKGRLAAANPAWSAQKLHNEAWTAAKKSKPKLFGAKA